MKNTPRKDIEAWDNRKLGASEEHVRRASASREKALDENLELQTISIRLQKSLVAALKNLAKDDGIKYQPFVRQILTRYVRLQTQNEKGKRIKHEKHHVSAHR